MKSLKTMTMFILLLNLLWGQGSAGWFIKASLSQLYSVSMEAAPRLGLEPSKVVLTGQQDLDGVVGWNISTWLFYGPWASSHHGGCSQKQVAQENERARWTPCHLCWSPLGSYSCHFCPFSLSRQSLSPTQIPPREEKVNFLAWGGVERFWKSSNNSVVIFEKYDLS